MSFLRTFRAIVSLASLALASAATAPVPGLITGNVSNAATRNLLPGARVEIPSLSLMVLADDTGRYELPGLPAGNHELLVTYIGLDPVRRTVVVGEGVRVSQDFELTTAIYRLDQFKVVGEREGDRNDFVADGVTDL
ncbi:MAG: hypothetical protein RLZZ221_2469, partial [Verrucomicrobiota bacterium]